jgi:hypothetical protein
MRLQISEYRAEEAIRSIDAKSGTSKRREFIEAKFGAKSIAQLITAGLLEDSAGSISTTGLAREWIESIDNDTTFHLPVVFGCASEGKTAAATTQAGNAVPERPDGQSLSWYQWARKMGDVEPVDPYLKLYLQGCTPRQAKAELAKSAAANPPTGWREQYPAIADIIDRWDTAEVEPWGSLATNNNRPVQLLRRGTYVFLCMRDDSRDWYIGFHASGAGRVSSKGRPTLGDGATEVLEEWEVAA